MPSKYDTNPLDPDFPEKIRAEAEGQPTQVLSDTGAAETRHFGPAGTAPYNEDQTVRLPSAGQQYQQYQQPYNGQYVPQMYQPQRFGAPERKIEPFGLSENVLTALPYIPWYLGLIAGGLILFLTSRSETKVRFHAAQGLAAHIGILIVTTVLGLIATVSGAAGAANVLFTIVTSFMLVIWAIKAWRGHPVHIRAIENLTNWLEEKIRKKE